MSNVTIEDLKRAQRMQDCMDNLQAKIEDCYEKHAKPLQESMKVKNTFRVCIMTIAKKGYRYYIRHADDCFNAEKIVNRFLLNTRTTWIRVLKLESSGTLWQEISFLDCRVPQSKYTLPL